MCLNRARLDGSEQTQIYISSSNETVKKISIDINQKLIYWFDAKASKIYKIDYEGHNKSVVLVDERYLKTVTTFTFFDNHLYWSDSSYEGGAILRGNLSLNEQKDFLVNITVLAKHFGDQVKDLAVFYRQPTTKDNPCQINNGDCEELCFFMGKPGQRRCECRHGHVASDGKTCRPFEVSE
jgi:hypothetical protein